MQCTIHPAARRIARLAARLPAVLALSACLLPAGRLAAQPSEEAVQKIREAYAASGNADTRADYERIIATLEEVLEESELTQRDLEYVRSLKGWAHNRRGEALVSEGDEANALEEFDRAVRYNSQHWKALHNRGVSLAHRGRIEEAIADFSRVLLLKQDYPNTWFNRGELLYERGELAEAIEDYTRAIELDAADPGFYNSRGHAHYRLRNYEAAVADYDRAIEHDPENPAARVNRGDVLLQLERFEDAAKDYMTAIQLDPHLGRAYQSAAWMMATCPVEDFRDAERAVNAARQAIELDGDDDYRYLETLAAAYANAEKFEDAVREQSRVLQMAPESDRERCAALLELYRQGRPFRLSARAERTANRADE